MQKRWVIKEQGDQKQVEELAQSLNIDESLSNLLVQRGVTTFDEARTYFRPSLSQLHDPFLMKDMDRAVERVEKAKLHRNVSVVLLKKACNQEFCPNNGPI